ncbi:MAG: PIG-L deacetylase family protein [Candidatus Woesearchaeota archaeon]|nr:PIG-L deacetylase family protein [Candidatus Woesearchaeota archaeon]
MAAKESILVLCAHSDDQVFGVGGTLAKYAEEGKTSNVIVFSFGENSHPWLKKHIIVETRVQETDEAGKILGIQENIFLGLKEGKFKSQLNQEGIEQQMKAYFKRFKPTKIFTHSPDDPHIDHREASAWVIGFCERNKFRGHVYGFNVWTPVTIKTRKLPEMVVDISATFGKKIKALRCFRSQWMAMLSLLWSVYWKAINNGRKHRMKYAEVFYKLR